LQPGNWIVLTISDTGVGIPAKYQPHIFEPFFTTKETGKGTGLGLAQVYGIVTEHNGCVDVVSKTNRGTTFSLFFPVSPSMVKVASQPVPASTLRGHGEVILLVEDAPSVLKATKTMLEYLGYQVLTASNGRTALQMYEQHQSKIGLVLTDITMPDMDGLALSQTLHKRNPTLKVVAITGYPLDTTREAKEWQAQGIVDWLQKPLTLERLGSTLYRLLKNGEESS
jgi:CheY-like chemotaxis protein